MPTERYRMRFDFQLNVVKADEYAIAEQIGVLKQQGLYSKTVRDGIRLVSDLREGNLDVLFELFPWVRAEFLEYVTSVQPKKSETETNIQRQLARIEELLANPGKPTSGAGPKAMKIPTMVSSRAEPEDEPELTLKKVKASGTSAQNFLDAAFGLVQ